LKAELRVSFQIPIKLLTVEQLVIN